MSMLHGPLSPHDGGPFCILRNEGYIEAMSRQPPPPDKPQPDVRSVRVDPDDVARWMGEFQLTELQCLWAIGWSEHRNARKAAREAGYAEASIRTAAYLNTRHAGCKALVMVLDRERIEYIPVTVADVLANSVRALRIAEAAKDVAGMIRANEQIGRHRTVRAFVAQAEDGAGSVAGGITPEFAEQLENLTPDEIDQLADLTEKLHGRTVQ